MDSTNLINKYKTEYFYRVSEFLIVFGTRKKFSHEKDFKGNDLPKIKETALSYLIERQQGIEKRGHFYGAKLVPPNTKIKVGEQSAYSIRLALVVKTGSEEEENILYGEDAQTIEDGNEIESLVYKELGFNLNY